MSNIISLLTNFQISKYSKFMFIENTQFPADPSIGQIAFVSGILYIYSVIKGIETWYPLTNTKNSYIHVQSTPALEWTVDHQLGNSQFIFCVYDTDNNVIHSNLKSVNDNNFVINFSEAISGKCVVFFEESYANLAINENSYIKQFIGKTNDGSETPTYSSTNHISNSDSLKTAIGKLDSAIVTTQNESPYINQFIGKTIEGTEFPVYSSTNYISNSDSLKTAIGKLDSTIVLNQNDGQYINQFIGKTINGVQLPTYSSTNYISNSDSLKTAIGKLDTAINNIPYDISGTFLGDYYSNDVILFFITASSFYIPINFAGSRVLSLVAPTSQSIFSIYKNATLIGTITFYASNVTGVFSSTSSIITLTSGDVIKIVAPEIVDTTLRNISISIAGTLQ